MTWIGVCNPKQGDVGVGASQAALVELEPTWRADKSPAWSNTSPFNVEETSVFANIRGVTESLLIF